MDVTIGSLAATQLRGNGSRENQADVVGPSFDLFLNFTEAIGPMQAMEHNTDEQYHQPDRHDDRSPSSESSTERDSERAENNRAYESRRDARASSSVEGRHEKDELALLAAQNMRGRSQANESQNAERQTVEPDEKVQTVDDSAKHSSDNDDDLAGAQGQTGEAQSAKTGEEQNTDVETLVDLEPDLESNDAYLNDAVEADDGELKAGELINQEIETVDANEAKLIAQPQHDEEQLDDAVNEGDDAVEFLDANERSGQLSEDDRSLTVDAAADQAATSQDELDSSSLFEFDNASDTDESRFLDDAGGGSQSDGSEGDMDAGQIDVMSDLDHEGIEPEGEWSRLLQGNSIADKVSQSSQANSTDSVRLGATATRVSQLDSGVARTPGAPGLAQEPTKTNASTPTKLAQPPTPGRLPEGVDELSIFRQISDAMKLRNGRIQRADIRLSPEELGAVRVQMEMKNGAVRVLVNTENAAVGDLVSNGLEQLRRDMLAQGVQVDQLEVRSELAGQDGQNDQPTDERDESMARDDQAEQPVKRRRRHLGRLSVQA